VKKFRVTIRTSQEWDKVIKAKDEDDARDIADSDFDENHYKNFDNSWKNTLIMDEESEIISVEAEDLHAQNSKRFVNYEKKSD